MSGMQPWQPGLGVDTQRWEMQPCQGCSHGSLGWGWIDGQRWEMQPCQGYSHGSLGWGWIIRGGRCCHAINVAMTAWIGDGWTYVGDAATTAWCGVEGRRWEMQPWQGCIHGSLGWGWMGRGGRCSHDRDVSMAAWVGGGWADVGDAAMTRMQPWQCWLGWRVGG